MPHFPSFLHPLFFGMQTVAFTIFCAILTPPFLQISDIFARGKCVQIHFLSSSKLLASQL